MKNLLKDNGQYMVGNRRYYSLTRSLPTNQHFSIFLLKTSRVFHARPRNVFLFLTFFPVLIFFLFKTGLQLHMGQPEV